MAIKEALKVSRKTFFDPRGWFNYDALKEQTSTVWSISKGVLNPKPAQPEVKETFDGAMQRLHVKEEDLKDIGFTYLFFAGLFVVFGLSLLGFGIYLLISKYYAGSILAIAFTAFLLSQAFKYHFWYFQVKNRKLGCTFEEWRRGKPDKQEVK